MNDERFMKTERRAWLIENGKTQGHGLRYLTFNNDKGCFDWTYDVYEALHLSRRRDADVLASECEDAWKIVEHNFTD